jgi:hypothetical protein
MNNLLTTSLFSLLFSAFLCGSKKTKSQCFLHFNQQDLRFKAGLASYTTVYPLLFSAFLCGSKKTKSQCFLHFNQQDLRFKAGLASYTTVYPLLLSAFLCGLIKESSALPPIYTTKPSISAEDDRLS